LPSSLARGGLALVALLALLVLLASPASSAPLGEQSGDVQGVRCTTRYAWPSSLGGGFFPVKVELHNTLDEETSVALEAEQTWYPEDRVTRRLSLAAGERVRFEALLRARAQGTNNYKFVFTSRGKELDMSGVGPTEFGHGRGGRTILYVANESVAAGVEESWSEEWTQANAKLGTSSSGMQMVVTCVRFDDLSPSWQAYTSVDCVLLDLGSEQPAPEDLEALLAWCRSGGKLIVLGKTTSYLDADERFGPLIEPRLRVQPSGEHGSFIAHGLEAFRCGFGVLVAPQYLASGPEPPEGSHAVEHQPTAFVADSTQFVPSWTRSSHWRTSRLSSALAELEEFDNLPLRALMLLMIGFAILMGPVNFTWVKRMRKPLMILVTVPVIAVVTSVALLLYGVLSQGLDIKAIRRSWAFLDQRTGQGTTVEARHVFAGSAPGEGLRPGAGTLVYPGPDQWMGGFRDGRLFVQDLDDGRLMSGDFFPIREPVGQMIVTDRAVRLRLDVRLDGESVVVTNALGVEVQELLLRDPLGDYHYLDGRLGEGEERRLEAGGSSAKSVEWSRELRWYWGETGERLVPGSYAVRLGTSPLTDDCGVEVNEIEGAHALVGLLDASVESWR